jgi:hypothetical protein
MRRFGYPRVISRAVLSPAQRRERHERNLANLRAGIRDPRSEKRDENNPEPRNPQPEPRP